MMDPEMMMMMEQMGGMGGGMPPADPMAGGMPPMDPAAMGGMPPMGMDPMAAMGGGMPMDPAAMAPPSPTDSIVQQIMMMLQQLQGIQEQELDAQGENVMNAVMQALGMGGPSDPREGMAMGLPLA